MNAAQFERSLADILRKQWVKLDHVARIVWAIESRETLAYRLISDSQEAISRVAKALEGVENE